MIYILMKDILMKIITPKGKNQYYNICLKYSNIYYI
jgi:hypothetical protein